MIKPFPLALWEVQVLPSKLRVQKYGLSIVLIFWPLVPPRMGGWYQSGFQSLLHVLKLMNQSFQVGQVQYQLVLLFNTGLFQYLCVNRNESIVLFLALLQKLLQAVQVNWMLLSFQLILVFFSLSFEEEFCSFQVSAYLPCFLASGCSDLRKENCELQEHYVNIPWERKDLVYCAGQEGLLVPLPERLMELPDIWAVASSTVYMQIINHIPAFNTLRWWHDHHIFKKCGEEFA